MIMRLDRHIAVRSLRDESSLPGTQMGIALPCLRFAVVLRRANHGRASGGPAALDGRRACRCTAAARLAPVRCLDGRARPGSGAAEERRSTQDRSIQDRSIQIVSAHTSHRYPEADRQTGRVERTGCPNLRNGSDAARQALRRSEIRLRGPEGRCDADLLHQWRETQTRYVVRGAG